MNEKTKKILTLVMAVGLVCVCAVWFFLDGIEHIEDTNGSHDFSLTTITDQDIIDATMGCMGFGRSTHALFDMVTFSSGKFTGVKEIMWTEVVYSTGVLLHIIDFEVTAGNFKMAVVNDGEIIRVIQPGEDLVDLGAITGRVSLVIAGESADFTFSLPESDYNAYSHVD